MPETVTKSLHELVGKLKVEGVLEMDRQPQSSEPAQRQIVDEPRDG